MVTSMTAFSRQSSQKDFGAMVWELRTVNHRFLDLTIRLPETLRNLEPEIRELLAKNLHRVKVEAFLRFTPFAQTQNQIKVNEALVQNLSQAAESIRKYFPMAQTDLISLLSWPGLVENEEIYNEGANAEAFNLLKQALD